MFEGWGAAVVGAAVVGAVVSSKSASKAADAQTQSAQAGINSTNYQFEQAKKILAPYVDAGTGSLTAQQDLLGLNGHDAQQKAINGIKNSSQFTELTKQGETGILQNAAATGGLRGGNTESALAQFRPALLNSLIDSQFNKLSGITQIGQASAAGTGSAGIQTGANVAALQQVQGQAQAGGYLAQGQAANNVANSIATYGMLKQAKVF